MKSSILILLSLMLFACKQNSTVSNNTPTNTSVQETTFITMERTPCFGKCPSHKITIFNTGNVIYEGYRFSFKEGTHSAKLDEGQLTILKNKIKEIDFFNLQDKYDSKMTDIPSCILEVEMDGKKKKILDRSEAPKKLRDFEKLIEKMVITEDLVKIEE